MQGIHGIYKSKGPSSHRIIDELRKITGIKTIGHAGTLDPLAKGILVVGIGRWAVRKLNIELKKEKEYLGKIKLGEDSSTDDTGGIKNKIEISKKPKLDEIKKIVNSFKGKIQQTPPNYSAIKTRGERAYKMALKGKKFKLKSRQVEVKKITLLKYKWPYLELKIISGPGFYVRSLARDIGQKLKTGGYLFSLERTRIGNYKKEKSFTLSDFKKKYEKRKMVLTLCPIIKNNRILLGMKKRGFGSGRWNGFGGKVDKGETISDSLKREIKEECGVIPKEISKRGIFIFEFEGIPEVLEVHLFSCSDFKGQPKETEEMRPEWFDFDKIPYQKMWPDDIYWMPLFLKGKNLRGEFYFKDKNTLLHYSLKDVKKI